MNGILNIKELERVFTKNGAYTFLLSLKNKGLYAGSLTASMTKKELIYIIFESFCQEWIPTIRETFEASEKYKTYSPSYVKRYINSVQKECKKLNIDLNEKYAQFDTINSTCFPPKTMSVTRKSFKDTIKKTKREAEIACCHKNWAMARSLAAESLLYKNIPDLIPSFGNVAGADVWLNCMSFDVKNCGYIPQDFIDAHTTKEISGVEYAKKHPAELAKFLYENQNVLRTNGLDPNKIKNYRIFIISTNPDKNQIDLDAMNEAIKNTDFSKLINIKFEYANQIHGTSCYVIFY